jgi:hypothetical protein
LATAVSCRGVDGDAPGVDHVLQDEHGLLAAIDDIGEDDLWPDVAVDDGAAGAQVGGRLSRGSRISCASGHDARVWAMLSTKVAMTPSRSSGEISSHESAKPYGAPAWGLK